MTIAFLVIILSGWALCIHFKKVGLGLALQLSSFVGIFLIITGIFPSILLEPLQIHPHQETYKWGHDNAIVLMGGGVSKVPGTLEFRSGVLSRVYEAARVYLDCKKKPVKCIVIVSGGDPTHKGISEAQIMANDLYRIGVASDDIILEDKSLNTYQTAKFVKPIIEQFRLTSVFLVTSGYHMRRSLFYFNNFSVTAEPVPSDLIETKVYKLQLSQNFFVTDVALHEWVGICRLYIYNWLGWN